MVVKPNLDEIILNPETLDEIYRKWLMKDNITQSSKFLKYRNYQRQTRNGRPECRFEDWLCRNGFTVFQKDKKRYLKYIGKESKLTFFLLKHS
jgi:uncharacterized LabA/DUF88 family protein